MEELLVGMLCQTVYLILSLLVSNSIFDEGYILHDIHLNSLSACPVPVNVAYSVLYHGKGLNFLHGPTCHFSLWLLNSVLCLPESSSKQNGRNILHSAPESSYCVSCYIFNP